MCCGCCIRESPAFGGGPPAEHTPLSQCLRQAATHVAAHTVIGGSLAHHSATRGHAGTSAAARLDVALPMATPPTESLTLRLSANPASPPSHHYGAGVPSASASAVPAMSGAPLRAQPGAAAAAPSSAGTCAAGDASTPGSDIRLGQTPRSTTASGALPVSPGSAAPSSVSPVKPSAVSQTPRPRNLDAYLPPQICEAYYSSKGPWPELYEWQVRCGACALFPKR